MLIEWLHPTMYWVNTKGGGSDQTWRRKLVIGMKSVVQTRPQGVISWWNQQKKQWFQICKTMTSSNIPRNAKKHGLFPGYISLWLEIYPWGARRQSPRTGLRPGFCGEGNFYMSMIMIMMMMMMMMMMMTMTMTTVTMTMVMVMRFLWCWRSWCSCWWWRRFLVIFTWERFSRKVFVPKHCWYPLAM